MLLLLLLLVGLLLLHLLLLVALLLLLGLIALRGLLLTGRGHGRWEVTSARAQPRTSKGSHRAARPEHDP